MSLDGFIAGPGHAMDWIAEYPPADALPEVMAATGAMLIGRGTYEVAKRMADQDTAYDGGAQFVLTHEPPDEPDPTVTFLTCELEEAVATARSAADSGIPVSQTSWHVWRWRDGKAVWFAVFTSEAEALAAIGE